MSPRAACRLDRLGFAEVCDYTAGKADWRAAGGPTQGARSGPGRAVDAIVRDVFTCLMSATLGDVASEIRGAALSTCVVLDDNGVVHGRLRPRELNGDPTGTVESVMELGPTTVRADEPLPDLLDRMARRNVTEVLVTNPEGQLLGIVTREKT